MHVLRRNHPRPSSRPDAVWRVLSCLSVTGLVILAGCNRELVPPTSVGYRVQRPAQIQPRQAPVVPPAAPGSAPEALTPPAVQDPDVTQESPAPSDPEQPIRDRFFSSFPDGSGWLGLGFVPVPVRVTRQPDVLELWAPGFGASIAREPGQLVYREGNTAPARLRHIAETPVREGTQYDLWMDSGKHLTAVFLRDGETLRWEGKSLRLN